MKRVLSGFLAVIMHGAAFLAFAGGAKEQPPAPVNNTWTLCVTQFDVSGMPPARAVMGQLVMQYIVEDMRTAVSRLWLDEEAAYYRTANRLKAESAAAKKLSAKQAERDKLIFAGNEGYKYKQAVKKVDKELAALRDEFAKSGVSVPPLAVSPAIKLTEENLAKNFPAPPGAGQEYYFCTGQKADAFLTGKVTWYFDRLNVEITLWSLYARKVTYTDSAIFSPDTIKEGSIELGDRLFDHISGFLPAWIKVKANPANALIIVGDYVAGEGETELMDFTPGTVSVTAFAENHETFTTDIDLVEGDRADVSIVLSPTPVDEFEVRLKDDGQPRSSDTPDEGASVYDGALYAGKTPLKLKGLSGQKKNLNLETPDGKIAQTVFVVSKAPIVFDPKTPPADERTEIARKKFYSAYGRLWIALPLAVLSIGLNNTMAGAYNRTGDPELKKQYDMVYWSSMGLSILMGACLAEAFYRIGRYVWEANKESSPLIKEKPEPELTAAAGTEAVADTDMAVAGTDAVTAGTESAAGPAGQDAAP
ncbi:MAG: PEGA domain-containing protein [Treponema sp.]|nr:PEGA domain-containing protein [Treponema sp.]